jgi:hypothetical protein
MHTALAVRREAGRSIETITGPRSAWRFRPHYHAGDEIVRLTAGRARLRLADGTRLIEAGETVVVAAGTVHRFEPVDAEGWAFTSEFALPSDSARDRLGPPVGQRLVARAIDLLARRDTLRSDAEELATECGVSAGYLARQGAAAGRRAARRYRVRQRLLRPGPPDARVRAHLWLHAQGLPCGLVRLTGQIHPRPRRVLR